MLHGLLYIGTIPANAAKSGVNALLTFSVRTALQTLLYGVRV